MVLSDSIHQFAVPNRKVQKVYLKATHVTKRIRPRVRLANTLSKDPLDLIIDSSNPGTIPISSPAPVCIVERKVTTVDKFSKIIFSQRPESLY
jgi:hypothetical protein